MEQVYYTQCPLGYGLSQSNGYQIKRRTPGYPTSADFRHLNMKVLLPGGQTRAPKALRYRRDGDVAEVVWLAPREREYETERGLWGRPGGLFAHGLRLGAEDLASIGCWPAGLYGSSLWCERDPVPSKGAPPPEVSLAAAPLACPPRTEDVARLAAQHEISADLLALALTAAARVTRDGRTLFVINHDERPERLAALVQALTFAFPEPMRADLTFSTYHDRPEELPGFRIQGTIPKARPNLMNMMSQGHVLNLTNKPATLEPNLPRASWANTLAEWLLAGRAVDCDPWRQWGKQAARKLKAAESFDDPWLQALIDFHRNTRRPVPRPDGPAAWSAIHEQTDWATKAGLALVWLNARPASWWTDASHGPAGRDAAAINAFCKQTDVILKHPKQAPADAWGEAAARWLRPVAADYRHKHATRFLQAWPDTGPDRAAFLGAFLGELEPALAAETLERFKAEQALDAALLLPIEAQTALSAHIERGDRRPFEEVLKRALIHPGAIGPVLDAAQRSLSRVDEGLADAAAGLLALALADAPDPAKSAVLGWAFARREAGARWVRPFLRATFSGVNGKDAWERLLQWTPAPEHARLAALAAAITREEGLPDRAFCWVIEKLVMPLPERARPRDPTWPDAYLARAPFLDLVQRLYSKDARLPELGAWLEQARVAGQLAPEQAAKLERCQGYYRGLKNKDASWLNSAGLPDVPAAHRGTILGQVLQTVGSTSPDLFDLCLDSCRRSWPGAFEAGVEGLPGIANALALVLAPDRADPAAWFARLDRSLDRLVTEGAAKLGPVSLASHVVARSLRLPDASGTRPPPWDLRSSLLRRADAWKALALDARGDLIGKEPTREALDERRRAEQRRQDLRDAEKRKDHELDSVRHAAHQVARADEPSAQELAEPAVAIFKLWFDQLDAKATFQSPQVVMRFYELMLNSCDGTGLAAIACWKAADLARPALRGLSWWRARSGEYEGARDDVREAFARLAPMAPLPGDRLQTLRNWLGRPARFEAEVVVATVDEDDGPVPLADRPGWKPQAVGEWVDLSDPARARWYCLDALSVFAKGGVEDKVRWQDLLAKLKDGSVPLHRLSADDQYAFLAWLVHETRAYGEVHTERLAHELVKHRMDDFARVPRWAEELAPFRDRIGDMDQLRPGLMDFVGDLRNQVRLRREELREGPRARRH